MLPLAVRYASFQRGFKLFYLRFKLVLAANRCNIGFECFLEDLPVVFCAKLCNELFRNLNFSRLRERIGCRSLSSMAHSYKEHSFKCHCLATKKVSNAHG